MARRVANNTVVEKFPVLFDSIEQRFRCLCRVLGLVQKLLNIDSVGALLPLHEPFNLLPPALNRDAVSSDPDFDRFDEVGEGSLAEQVDVSGRRTGVANIVDVGFLRSDADLTVRKAQ